MKYHCMLKCATPIDRAWGSIKQRPGENSSNLFILLSPFWAH